MKKRIKATVHSSAQPGSPAWIFQGDIRKTIRAQSAEFLNAPPESIKLVITSPPDLSETPYTHWKRLFELYRTAMERCVRGLRSDGVVSIIVTDRKWKGTIVFKHQLLTTLLGDMGLELFLHKILVRNFGINMFRLGFSHILCFRRKERSGASRDTGRLSAEFRRDMWGPFASAGRGPSARNGFPPEVVKLLVESFTRPKDMVLDPFCGCGTTQRVALGMGRRAFGFETNPKLARFWSSIERPTKLGQRP